MTKFMAWLAGFFCFYTLCPAAPAKDSVKQTDNKSLLWKIAGKDMKKASYLFGTIHLLCKDDYLWTTAMKKSLKSCKEVCFEMDMDDPSLMMEIAEGMIDNSGKTLKDYFTQEDYHLIEKFVADSLGMSLAMFQQMKPAALQSLFATKAVSCADPVSYEANIMEEAQKLKLEITGLEEAKEQLALFNNLEADSVVKELVEMAKDYSKERMEYKRMLVAYKKQDLPLLYKIIEDAKKEGDDTNAFVDERNIKWIDRMEEKMDQHSVFFAVGAGHLWGENGIINLLRLAGYTVAPVK